jgi:protein JSN1
MNGKEIFPGAGPIRINFAKPPSASNTPGHDGVFPSPSPDPFANGQDNLGGSGLTTSADGNLNVNGGTSTPTVPPMADLAEDMMDIVTQFGATDEDRAAVSLYVHSAIHYTDYVEEIPPIREPTHTRVHDAPKLRDIRKRIDNQLLSKPEIENIAVDMLPEIAELASDYLGNTVVQKLFEHCSDQIRDAMLVEIVPHLAEIGVHKNGTWAAQKIIAVCKTHEQKSTIVEHLKPYTVPLFLDQYGNYVLQGCLNWGPPYNNFFFEGVLSRMWEIAQGRCSSRAVRGCLESKLGTRAQDMVVSAATAIHSAQLATNANSALLLTFFLDSCAFPKKRTVLAPRLVPHLVYLCTHKVAYVTVLKIINQKTEPEARDIILKALFFSPNDQVLEAILQDPNCGATLIFKVLTTPFFDDNIRAQVIDNVKTVLIKLKAQPSQGYKRLMDEVGLSTRAAPTRENSGTSEGRPRPTSRQANNRSLNGQSTQGGQPNNHGFYNPIGAQQTIPSMDTGYGKARNEPADPAVAAFPQYGQSIMYSNPAGPMPAAVNLPPLQYSQNMMNRPAPQMGYNYPTMQASYAGYGAPQAPAIDPYRQANLANGSPIQPPTSHMPPPMPTGQPPYAPPGFGVGVGGYGYGNMGGMQSMGYMQQEQSNNRRGGRVCILMPFPFPN